MHKFGMCHRDLKPENLIISKQLTLQIIDFGSAKFMDGRSPEEQGRAMTDDLTRKVMHLTTTITGTPKTTKREYVGESNMYVFSFVPSITQVLHIQSFT